MKQWIRWKGFIPFVVVLVLVLGFWFLFLDGLVERMLEKSGTRLVGAKVELDSVDVTLSPLGIRLNRLQVTNPGKPMENAVEIGRSTYRMNLGALLRRKAVIENMEMVEIQFNTPRKHSGAVKKTRPREPGKPARAKKSFLEKLPTLDFPKVGEVLAKEDLQTLELAKELKQDLTQAQDTWQKRFQDLPGEETIKEYRQRVDAAAKSSGNVGDVLTKGQDMLSLQKEIKRDLKAIEDAKQSLNKEVNGLQTRLQELKNAPQKDVQRLTDKYGLSPKGLSNVSRVVFGPKVASWVARGFYWYNKTKPYWPREGEEEKKTEVRQRAEGVDVTFPERQPFPDFLIRKGDISAQTKIGKLQGSVRDITLEQVIWGKPAKIELSGKEESRSISLSGTLDHTDPDKPEDTLNIKVRKYPVADAALSGEVPVALKKSILDADVDVTMAGPDMSGRILLTMKDNEFVLSEKTDNILWEKVARVLSTMRSISVTGDLQGTREDYTLKISSNADQALRGAVQDVVKEEMQAFRSKLDQEVQKRTGSSIEEVEAGFKPLLSREATLEQRQKVLQQLLQEAVKGGGKKGVPLPF